MGGASEAEVAAAPVCGVRGEGRRSGHTVPVDVGGGGAWIIQYLFITRDKEGQRGFRY